MKILSGVDLVLISRIERIISRDGDSFIKRVFTPKESEYCDALSPKRRIESYAARYAAKEAASKALGTGICTRGIGFLDFEVIKEEGRAPELKITGVAAEELAKRKITSVSVSLTHDGDYAQAFCNMLSEENSNEE